jgi:hypothetical protein
MKIVRIMKDIITLGADWRVRNKEAEFDVVRGWLDEAVEGLAGTRYAVKGKVEHLVKTKTHAVQSLRLIRKLSKNLEAKPRLIAGSDVRTPFIAQLIRIDKTIGTEEIAKNTMRGLTAGTSTALGTWALIGAYGTASTGTSIAGLSGAAASNAILAWLGGGSIAAGGGGIATGTVVLGGIVLIPAVLITGILNHVAASRKIKEIAEQEVCALAHIKQCKESELILGAFGKRVEEVDISIDKARSTFEIEFARAYKLLFPYGLLSMLFKHIRRFFGRSFFWGGRCNCHFPAYPDGRSTGTSNRSEAIGRKRKQLIGEGEMKTDLRLKKLNEVTQYLPGTDVLSFFNKLLEAHQEYQHTERDLARISAMKEVILTEITSRYDLYHTIFDRIFDERKEVIDKHFDIIDRGIASDDKQLVLAGLEGLGRIVSTSPFANVQELSKLLESGRKIEI